MYWLMVLAPTIIMKDLFKILIQKIYWLKILMKNLFKILVQMIY